MWKCGASLFCRHVPVLPFIPSWGKLCVGIAQLTNSPGAAVPSAPASQFSPCLLFLSQWLAGRERWCFLPGRCPSEQEARSDCLFPTWRDACQMRHILHCLQLLTWLVPSQASAGRYAVHSVPCLSPCQKAPLPPIENWEITVEACSSGVTSQCLNNVPTSFCRRSSGFWHTSTLHVPSSC